MSCSFDVQWCTRVENIDLLLKIM